MSTSDINNYVFYKIVCIDEAVDLSYVGSTCDLNARINYHKRACNNPNRKDYNYKKYKIIRANGGWENFKFIQIGQREQITEIEACQIEEDYRVNLKANMNDRRCYRTEEVKKEQKQQGNKKYREKHKDEMREYQKEYRVTHKEEKREYREKNKEQLLAKSKIKITCECGCEIQKCNISKHLKTEKHLDLMKNNNE